MVQMSIRIKALFVHLFTATGAVLAMLAMLAAVCGIALIWWVWWLAALSFVSLIGYAIHHTFNYDREFHIPAEEVAAAEDARTHQLALTGA